MRDKDNDANHEIDILGREDLEQLITFGEVLMRIMNEHPAEMADSGHAAIEEAKGTCS